MAEGRVRNDGTGTGLVLKMEYFITDQQGNTRVSFEDDGTNTNTVKLKQENSYYAFGMQMAGGYTPTTHANKKLYNAGSEWQDDEEGLADYYSTFFREYDPMIGRFNGVDPLAEVSDEITIYAYANNNPVMMNDPMGDLPKLQAPLSLAQQMQNEYNSWHDSKYGDNFFERGWGNEFDGEHGSAGGGGRGRGGTYSDLKARQDYLGSPEWIKEMEDKDKSDYFWNLMKKWKKDGYAEVGLYYYDEETKGGIHYNYDQKKGILFRSADAAAIFWANRTLPTARKDYAEYSAVIYWIQEGKDVFYGATEGVRFPNKYGGPDPRIKSPGPNDPLQNQIPTGGTLFAFIHIHIVMSSLNEDFSPEDQQTMANVNTNVRNNYVVTPTGRVLHNNPGGNNSRYLGRLIGNNLFTFKREQYPEGFDFTQH